jgi:hypothetical protein
MVARKFHPDANQDDRAAANDVMKIINNFYDMLLHGKSEEAVNKAPENKAPEKPVRSYDDFFSRYITKQGTIKVLTGYKQGELSDVPQFTIKEITDEDRAEIKKANTLMAKEMPIIDKMTSQIIEKALKIIPDIEQLRWGTAKGDLVQKYGEEWWYSKEKNKNYKSDIGLGNIADFVIQGERGVGGADSMFDEYTVSQSLYKGRFYDDVESRLNRRMSYLNGINETLDQFEAHQAEKASSSGSGSWWK